jgi:hypothetical protein
MKATRTLLVAIAAAAAAGCSRTPNPVAPAEAPRFSGIHLIGSGNRADATSSVSSAVPDSSAFGSERGTHLIGGGN